ncbi:MAG: endonuclease/exonuclease/phosphatase family protein [Actinobacteria bacterium]|nr:endonuclease/exonuclease/phosphatase family protein [Actinomycetota bacterium]
MPRPRLRTRARLRRSRLLAAGGWALVAPSAVVAGDRLVRHQRHGSVLMLEALGPVWALPTLAALGIGALARRPTLAAVAGALAGLHGVWLAPELRPAAPAAGADGAGTGGGSGTGGGRGEARFRIFSHNVLFTNTDMDGIAAEIAAADPDVVALQEVSVPNLAALEHTGLVARFPHRWLDARPDALGTAILSRLPLEGAERWPCAGLVMARATVVVGDRRVRLYDVHTRAPFGPGAAAHWEEQLGVLAGVVREVQGPLVLAGDYNASSGHRAFRDLLAAGVADAHVAAGRWWATTWPHDLPAVPSLARIDHVLVNRHVAVAAVAEGEGRGSDHQPVVADLVVTA